MYIILGYMLNDKIYDDFGGHVTTNAEKKKIAAQYKKDKAAIHKCDEKDINLIIKDLTKDGKIDST